MTDLAANRRAIRHLLDEYNPADAAASYYAFYHPDGQTQLLPYPNGAERAQGYMALSRTGMDLFRPLLTLRLPIQNMAASTEVIYQELVPGTAVILLAPTAYLPLLQALFEIHSEEHLDVLVLDRSRFEPIINVLVSSSTGPNRLPRFVIRNINSPEQEVVAASGINWQTPHFAEISVNTAVSQQRHGYGKSVAAAMVQYLLSNGRTPLYMAAQQNMASQQLARSIGFTGSGVSKVILQAVLRPRP
ncbi:MAG: GNAT family N-acetyltransferase [Ardenticatenaceae bacterium]|nr:GNAT family N-acetyltransferase [Ardenticatenaceae bacterium]MCB9445444.1 GNAT family N-acetyltransferase [Ardenticatenaceae bacterium]